MRVQNRRVRSLALVIVAMLLAVVSTGCLTGNVDVKVDKDGSGSIEVKIFPNDDLQKFLVGGGLIPVIEDAVDQVRDSSFEKINDDGRIGYKVKMPFDDYQELGRTLVNGTIVGETPIRLFSSFELTEINDEWRLNAVLAPEMLSEALKADPTTQELIDSAGLSPLNSDLLLTISLPGKISRTNGKQVASGSATWALKTNTDATLQMLTVPKPLLTDTQKIFLGAVAAIFVGMFLTVWGSQHSWGRGAERKERRRTKNMTFKGSSPVSGTGWQNQGPVAHAPEGTVPTSGPMPPRSIPSLSASGVSVQSPAQPEQRLPNGELPVVGPPIAPVVDPTAPNPFAPHRPGAPLPGTVPVAPPSITPPVAPTPPLAPVSSPDPVPTSPPVPAEAPVAVTATADEIGVDAEIAAAPMGSTAPPPTLTPEQATAQHDAIYRDPSHELVGVEGKAHHDDQSVPNGRDGHHDSSEVETPVVDAPGESTAKSSEKAPWWFESKTGQAADTRAPSEGMEPAWVSSDESGADLGRSPFSTGVEVDDDEYDTSSSHYVAAGGGFFDYVDEDSTPVDDVPDSVTETIDRSEDAFEHDTVTHAASPVDSPSAVEDDGPAWMPPETSVFDDDVEAEYPSIDGGGGLDVDLSAPVFEESPEMDYPSIDGSGGLAVDPEAESEIPPDWYPDPDDPERFRWWDGVEWTDFVSDSGS